MPTGWTGAIRCDKLWSVCDWMGRKSAIEQTVRPMRLLVIIILLALLVLPFFVIRTRTTSRLYTEDDVRKFVQPGTPLTNIIERFGQPWHDEKNPKFESFQTNVDEIVYFNLPDAPPGTKEDFVFCGFQVRLKDGNAVDWFSTHETRR